MTTAQMTIRRLRTDDLERHIEFIAQAYGQSGLYKGPSRHAWQHQHNPFQFDKVKGPAIWVAECDGQIIGQIAVQDGRLQLGGQEMSAGWIVDVIVLPEFRGMGLGHSIHDKLLVERDILVTLTMAPATRRIAERAGCVSLTKTTQFVRHTKSSGTTIERLLRAKLETRPNLRRVQAAAQSMGLGPAFVASLVNSASDLTELFRSSPEVLGGGIEEVQSFSSDIDVFWKRIAPHFPASFVRSAEFLNWRFCDVPDLQYRRFVMYRDGQVCGYVIVRKAIEVELPCGVLLDVCCNPNDQETVDCLVGFGTSVLAQDCEYIDAASSDPRLAASLRRHGFWRVRDHYPTVVVREPELRRRFELSRQNWHFSKADHDWDQIHPM